RIEDVNSNTSLQQDSLPGENPSSPLGSRFPSTPNFNTADRAENTTDVFLGAPTSCSLTSFNPNPSNHQITASGGGSVSSATQVQSTWFAPHSSTPTFSQIYNAVRQTLPPASHLAPQSSTYYDSSTAIVQVSNPVMNHTGAVSAPSTVSRSSSIPRIGETHSRVGSVAHAGSLALDDWSSREGSTIRDSPAPVINPVQKSTIVTQTQPIRSIRQRDFHYDQVVFMNAMRKRWHWYLIADDSFPINTSVALELCVQYAEETLGISRRDADMTRSALDFVRRKDSAIRNLFQTGLLSIIEAGYGVNVNTTEKLNKLISQSNYIYAEYDIETKKVSGRYRHPCLIDVLKAILFTRRKRGRAIGVFFMPEVIGRDNPAAATGEPGGTGISVSMIALACTLRASGTRKGKPLHFTEKKYSAPYRSFVTLLQQYPRLNELRKTYLEEIMGEYLRLQVDNDEESDVDIGVDDEMHSDGD
ncbi:hypothetical protein FRC11_014389, partial [Ceratobasidium sp. 423]